MHERTRRQLCRLAFVALCAVPTLISSTWAAYRASPFYAATQRAAWESLLLERTGLVATINEIAYPPGGSIVLGEVELIDPDGGQRVARMRQIEIAETPQGLVFILSQPQIAKGKFLRLWDMLHDRVLRGPPPTMAMQISTGELTVEIGQQAQTFTHVCCTVEPLDIGVRALIDFQLAGIEMPSPARLKIDRNRQITPPTTSWVFHTDSAVPCELFRDYFPGIDNLGSNCRFQGHVEAIMARGDWSAEVAGRFLDIDLDRATDSFPHKLTGIGNLAVERAHFQQGKLREAVGQFIAHRGTASVSLLRSLSEQFGAILAIDVSRSLRPLVKYHQFAFAFSVLSDEVKIVGRCAADRNDIVMCTQSEALLRLDPTQPQPLVAMIRALSPASDVLIPATEESKGLLDVLSFPPSQPARTEIARPPHVRVHLD